MTSRFALLIGNSAYPTAPLTNPAADVQTLARVLGGCGFDVTVASDHTADQMMASVHTFAARLSAADGLGFLFFAGHGCELNNTIFMLPVDCGVPPSIGELPHRAVPITDLEAALADVKSSVVIVMDACRSQLRTDGIALPDDYKDLTKHRPPVNSLYVFSTASGNEASDGAEGANSPFTAALAQAFVDSHLDIETLIRRAVDASAAATKGVQRARVEGGLTRPFPLAPTLRLVPSGKLTAYGARGLYGLCGHPAGSGVLGWTAENRIYELKRQGAVEWLNIKADEILCVGTAGDTVWIAFRSNGKTMLGRARMDQDGRCTSVPSIELGLEEAHAISVDLAHQRVYVAGRDAGAGQFLVYAYADGSLRRIAPEGCGELYIATPVDGDRVLLGGPDDFLAMYSLASGDIHPFADASGEDRRHALFYSFAVFGAGFALAGGSNGRLHPLDLDKLLRHPPVALPTHWRDDEVYDALGEVADEAGITTFLTAPDTLDDESRAFLAQQLPGNNVLTLIKSEDDSIVVACTDLGRVYSVSVRDRKVIDYENIANGRSSGQAIIDASGNVYVDTGKGEVAMFRLTPQ